VTRNRAAAQRFMKAMREEDYDTIADILSPDFVINSPITAAFSFRGREDAMTLFRIVRAEMEDLKHHELLGADDSWTQRFEVRVRGRLLEGVDVLRFDAGGRLAAMTVFVRPLCGLTAFAAAVAPSVGRHRGRLAQLALRLLMAPLAAMTCHGDRFAAWLLRGSWGITR
jgi:hypothetical protein